jgi:acetyl esterase
MHGRTFFFVFILTVFLATSVMAQISATPPEVAAKIREMGKNLSPEVLGTTMKLYMPLHGNVDRSGVKVTKDEQYGTDERHRLDVYEPSEKAGKPMPILVFVHGGGFVAGNKSSPDSPFFGNIGYYLAKRGILTVIPTYRLAPKHKWPAGTEDVAGALTWVRKNGEKFGGNTNRIVIMGHSAGGAHVASYIFQEEFQLKEGDGLIGAILLSGVYDPEKAPAPPYYGEDKSKYPSMAPIKYIDGRKIPVFIVFAEFDPYFIDGQTSDLFQALCQRDKACPTIKQLMGHNHLSEAYHIGTADESIGPDIVEFIRTRGPLSK